MMPLRLSSLVCSAVVAVSGCVSLPPSKGIGNYRAYNLINSKYTTIGDLAGSSSTDSDNQISISAPARIMVSAQVNITNPGGLLSVARVDFS
jgi:hypothetical protein